MAVLISRLKPSGFVKSVTSHANHRKWQDVYHLQDGRREIYVKFTDEVVTEFILLSFKERQSMRDEVRFSSATTMIHPETGAVLFRRRRMETVEYMGLKRDIEVEAFWPDGEGDGVLVGDDHAPLEVALHDMKAEHAARIRELSLRIRKAAGLTQKEASQLLTGSPNSFSKYERGEAQPSWPTFVLLKLIASDPSLIDKIRAA